MGFGFRAYRVKGLGFWALGVGFGQGVVDVVVRGRTASGL